MKKNKKNIIIVSCIIAVVVFFIVLLLLNNKIDLASEKELIVDCSKSFTYEGYDQIFELELYKDDDSKYLIQKLIMRPKTMVDDDLSEIILYQLDNKMKLQFEKTFQNNRFVDYDVYIEENQYISEISYIINNDNKSDMISILEYDYFGNSIDDIIFNIEKGGLKCLKQ